MSYDIRFGVETLHANNFGEHFAIIDRPQLDSPTYNLGKMFRACMDWDFEVGIWYPYEVFMPAIERGIHELIVNEDCYIRYNPANGWGSLENAREVLKSCYDTITDDFGMQAFWPIKYVWMKW